MKARYLVGRTYDETTHESAEIGDFSDSGWVKEPRLIDLEDLLGELRDCSELSNSGTPDTRTWASTGWQAQFDGEGTERQESVHINAINGRQPSSREMIRIYRLAGLTK